MRTIKTLAVAAVFVGVAIVVYQIVVNNRHLPSTPSITENDSELDKVDQTDNNLADTDTSELESTDVVENNTSNIPTDTSANDNAASISNSIDQSASNLPPLAAYDIANEPITEEGLLELVNRLNSDPRLMNDVINELRAESDPDRLKRLVYILGSTGNSAVLPAAEEMIYSGVEDTRDSGLDLLSRIASENPEAYAVASSLLVSETEPEVLIATINVMAQPAEAPPEVRDTLVTQLTPLSTHESTAVRGFSVSTLARLSNDPELSPVFYNALFDTEAAVRSSGVYAFSSFPYHSAETSEKLMNMVEDEFENLEVRRGAMLALSNNSPDEVTQSRLDAAEKAIRLQVRQRRLSGN